MKEIVQKNYNRWMNSDKVSEEERKKIQENIDALKKANEGENLEAIKKGIEELTNSSMKLGEAIYKQQQAQQQSQTDANANGGAGPETNGGFTSNGQQAGGAEASRNGDDDVVDADYTEKK